MALRGSSAHLGGLSCSKLVIQADEGGPCRPSQGGWSELEWKGDSPSSSTSHPNPLPESASLALGTSQGARRP